MGAAILKEYIDVETEKQERVDKAKKSEKAAKEAAAERVSNNSSFSILRIHSLTDNALWLG